MARPRTKSKHCEFCGTEITGMRRSAMFCSSSCRAKHYRRFPWTEEEREFLKANAPELHSSGLAASLNRFNNARGYHAKRTIDAVRRECSKMGIFQRDRIDHLSACSAARLLDVGCKTIVTWIEKGWLKAKKRKWEWSIRVDDLISALWNKPHLAIGADPENLKLLMLDRDKPNYEQMMEEISKAKDEVLSGAKVHRRISYRIRCLDNNTIYPSIWSASAGTGCTRQTIRYWMNKAIAKNKRTFEATGVMFEIIDTEPTVNRRKLSTKDQNNQVA